MVSDSVSQTLLSGEEMTDSLKRLRVLMVSDAGQDTIDRALRLQHALDGNLDASTQSSDGAALVGIVTAWMSDQTAKMRAKP